MHPINKVVRDAFAKTDLPFITMNSIDVSVNDLRFLEVYRWNTLVVSSRNFKAPFRDKYDRQAEVNIPKIQFGSEQEKYDAINTKGGVVWVIGKIEDFNAVQAEY